MDCGVIRGIKDWMFCGDDDMRPKKLVSFGNMTLYIDLISMILHPRYINIYSKICYTSNIL